MQPASAGGANGGGNRALRRWGPIAGIVAVIAIVVGVVVVAGGDDDDDGDVGGRVHRRHGWRTPRRRRRRAPGAAPRRHRPRPTSGTDGTAGGTRRDPVPADVLPGREPRASRATSTGASAATPQRGRLAFPDYFAPECYAPFDGDNGGATSPGVTDDTIKLVWYLAPEQDPIINYITDAIAGDDTNDQRIETMENVVRFYHTYYELYGRRIELIPFQGIRLRGRRGGGAGRRGAHRRGDPAVRRALRPGADHGVQRRAGRPPGHVHRLRTDPTDELLRRARARTPGPSTTTPSRSRTTSSSSSRSSSPARTPSSPAPRWPAHRARSDWCTSPADRRRPSWRTGSPA